MKVMDLWELAELVPPACLQIFDLVIRKTRREDQKLLSWTRVQGLQIAPSPMGVPDSRLGGRPTGVFGK